MTLGAIVFGVGRMGAVHARNVAAHPGARLVWVVDADPERGGALARALGARFTTQADEALADPAAQAAIIASPTDTHVALIEAAARAGKAILCEKPIDLDCARVDACAEAIAGMGVPVMIGFQRRFDPTHRAVAEAIAAGEAGRIEGVTVISRDPAPPPFSYVATSGGQFRDQMIHDLDLALWLTEGQGHWSPGGEVEVFAMAGALFSEEIGALGDSDTAHVLMRLPSGAFVRVECSRRAVYGYDQRVEIAGSGGMLRSENLRPAEIERWSGTATAARDRLMPSFMERYLPCYAAELDAFLAAVRDGAAPSPGFAEGRRALLLADAAQRSVEAGAPQRVVL